MTKKIRYSKANSSAEDDAHSKYWEKRVANHVWSSYNTLEEENYALIGYYDKTLNDIRLQLYNLAEREKSGDLTRTQRYLKNHLEELRKQIEDECEKLGKKVESKATSNIIKEMQSNSQNIFSNISGGKFSMLSKNTCKEILNNPWHGSYFSKRLWKDTGKLAIDLNDILAVGISQGKTVAEMAFELSNRVHQSMNSVHRLVRTETINALNNATLRSYKEADVKFVRWWAAEDERTCKVCGENHGKVYPIDKAPNLPCHPGCRCTWLPVFEDELMQFSEDLLAGFKEMKQKELELPLSFKFSKEKQENLSKTYAEILRREKQDGCEHMALCYADTGKMIGYTTDGRRKNVNPNEEMIELLYSTNKAEYVLIHNHPQCTPIAARDIAITVAVPSIKESIVVTSIGDIYLFSVGNGDRIIFEDEEQISEFISYYEALVKTNGGNRELALKILCKERGWDFGKTKQNKD